MPPLPPWHGDPPPAVGNARTAAVSGACKRHCCKGDVGADRGAEGGRRWTPPAPKGDWKARALSVSPSGAPAAPIGGERGRFLPSSAKAAATAATVAATPSFKASLTKDLSFSTSCRRASNSAWAGAAPASRPSRTCLKVRLASSRAAWEASASALRPSKASCKATIVSSAAFALDQALGASRDDVHPTARSSAMSVGLSEGSGDVLAKPVDDRAEAVASLWSTSSWLSLLVFVMVDLKPDGLSGVFTNSVARLLEETPGRSLEPVADSLNCERSSSMLSQQERSCMRIRVTQRQRENSEASRFRSTPSMNSS
mmetsp:Transcript_34050/g.97840  ORF Transcript_34050/g.97840 Transcript_34050/m.97840 type:complete len:313 (+) Transcript_34050:1282-2220(+)